MIGGVTGAIAAVPGSIASELAAQVLWLMVPDGVYIQDRYGEVETAWSGKTVAVANIASELGQLGGALTTGTCANFAGVAFSTPAMFGGGTYTFFGDLGGWWCPWQPLASTLIKLGAGAGFAAALLSRLRNR
jgi:hypothetical protein